MAISPGMRMLMLAREKDRYPRSDYSDNGDRRMIGFDRYPDTRADPNMRYPYTRTDPNMRYHDRPDQMTAGMPYMPPIYPMTARDGNSYGDIYAHGSIYAPGAMNKPERDTHSRDRDYDHESDRHHDVSGRVDEHKAREWVKKMTSGEHFKPEITDQLKNAICPDCDKWEFYAAMNAMYSDYSKTAQRMGMDKADFYANLAKDFLKDEDAKPNKLYRYMTEVAK